MTLAHAAYLFNVQGFRDEIGMLRPDLAKQEYYSLRKQASLILEAQSEIWRILEDFRFFESDVEQYETRGIGEFWTSVILARHLQLCPSIDQPTWEHLFRSRPISTVRNWQVLERGLLSIGWIEEEVLLLIEGMSMEWLLRPDLVTGPMDRLRPADTWYSLGRKGWLDRPEIDRLLIRLEESRDDFLHLKPIYLPLKDRDGALVSDEQIEMAFVCTVGMLQTAQVAGKGLLMAILS